MQGCGGTHGACLPNTKGCTPPTLLSGFYTYEGHRASVLLCFQPSGWPPMVRCYPDGVPNPHAQSGKAAPSAAAKTGGGVAGRPAGWPAELQEPDELSSKAAPLGEPLLRFLGEFVTRYPCNYASFSADARDQRFQSAPCNACRRDCPSAARCTLGLPSYQTRWPLRNSPTHCTVSVVRQCLAHPLH